MLELLLELLQFLFSINQGSKPVHVNLSLVSLLEFLNIQGVQLFVEFSHFGVLLGQLLDQVLDLGLHLLILAIK